MNEELRMNLRLLKFKPTEYGAMKGRVEDVEFTVISNPLGGTLLTAAFVGSREAAFLEVPMSAVLNLQQIAQILSDTFEKIHPERNTAGKK